MKPINNPKKILIQRADRLGDLVLALPVIERIKQNLPHSKITLLTSSIGEALAKEHPLIDHVITVKGHSLVHKSYWKLVDSIKRKRFDAYVSLWNNPLFAYLGFLCKIPVRVGDKSNPSLALFYTHRVFQQWNDFTRHQINFNLDLLEPFQFSNQTITTKVYTSKETDIAMLDMMRQSLPESQKTVLIFTCTGGTNHPIPEHALIPFIHYLLEHHFNVILCGQGKVTTLNGSLLLSLEKKNLLNLIGKTTLSELISIIKLSDFYIGPDTGPTHLASFLKKPILFFSPIKPNPPSRWGPHSLFIHIMREEFHSSKSSRCFPIKSPPCFDYVTTPYLIDAFKALYQRVQNKSAFSFKTRKEYFLLHSFRVLYIVHSKKEFLRINDTIESLRQQGLKIFPFYYHNFNILSLITFIVQKNINIVQGHFSLLVRVLISLSLGTLLQYIRPIFISQTLNKHIQLREYLHIYKIYWGKAGLK